MQSTIGNRKSKIENLEWATQGMFLEVLRSFGSARLRVTGTSMLPSIWPGDILEVRRVSLPEIVPGQLVLVERLGRFRAHRVERKVEREGRTLLVTRGDRLLWPDPPVPTDNVLGRVTLIHRGSSRIVPGLTPWSRLAAWVLSHSEVCTR